MSLRRAFHLVLIGAILSGGLGMAQLRCPMDTRNSDLAAQFRIGGPSIQLPIGAFLLVRKNGEIGTIRLTSIDSRATEYLGKFTYESFFPADHSGLFPSSTPKVIRQSGELEVKPEGGLIRGFAYQPGPHIARIGSGHFHLLLQT
jgi:hypothetical protein